MRFALIYVVLLALSTASLATFLWWSTAGLLDQQTNEAIHADAQGLIERWSEGGLEALKATIQDRIDLNVDGDAIYLLADGGGQIIGGNLQTPTAIPIWPPGITQENTSYPLPIRRWDKTESRALVQRFNLPDGASLLVGRDVQVRGQLSKLLTDALIWALLVVVVMAVVGAMVVRVLFLHAIADISDTAAAISAGDLTRRVRQSGRGDEFDLLSETINDMLSRIARLMDGVREVSNAIAHDLRTPITRARARLEEAALHAGDADSLRAAIDRAIADLDGIVSIFSALLRIAQIESGTRRAAFTSFEVTRVLDDLFELYQAVAEEQKVYLDYEKTDRLYVHGDQAMVQQAVANIIDNAIKFSPPNGHVKLFVFSHSDWVGISVTDEGPGIKESDRERATDRFFRAESARNTPGSGLGLALVLAVARLHGGDFVLTDAMPGIMPPGLRAVIRLPIDSARQPHLDHDSSLEQPRAREGRL